VTLKPSLTREGFVSMMKPHSHYVETFGESCVEVFKYDGAEGTLFVQWDERFVTATMMEAIARWAGAPLARVQVYTRSQTAAVSVSGCRRSLSPPVTWWDLPEVTS
jgi:hypothetical protein